MLTFGLGDEAIDLGADLLRHMDDIDAGEVMKASRGLSRVDEAASAVRAENRLAREALVKADIGTGLNRADDVLETRLRNLVDAPSGDGTVRRGAELRAALSSGSNRRTLSEQLDAAAARRKSVFSDQCANSFTAGAPVETEEGQKPIEEIEIGDKVLAEDPETGEQGYFEVVALTNRPSGWPTSRPQWLSPPTTRSMWKAKAGSGPRTWPWATGCAGRMAAGPGCCQLKSGEEGFQLNDRNQRKHISPGWTDQEENGLSQNPPIRAICVLNPPYLISPIAVWAA